MFESRQSLGQITKETEYPQIKRAGLNPFEHYVILTSPTQDPYLVGTMDEGCVAIVSSTLCWWERVSYNLACQDVGTCIYGNHLAADLQFVPITENKGPVCFEICGLTVTGILINNTWRLPILVYQAWPLNRAGAYKDNIPLRNIVGNKLLAEYNFSSSNGMTTRTSQHSHFRAYHSFDRQFNQFPLAMSGYEQQLRSQALQWLVGQHFLIPHTLLHTTYTYQSDLYSVHAKVL